MEFRFARNRVFFIVEIQKKKKTTKKEATHTHTHAHIWIFFRSVKFIEPFLRWWINHRVSYNDRKYSMFDRDS